MRNSRWQSDEDDLYEDGPYRDILHRDDLEDVPGYDPLGPEGRPRGKSRLGTLVGIATGITAGLAVAAGAVWWAQGSFAFGVPGSTVAQAPARVMTMAPAGATVAEVALVVPSGMLDLDANLIYMTSVAVSGRPFGPAQEQADASAARTGRSVPLPMANPLNRGQYASGDGMRTFQQLDGGVPLPMRKPSISDQRLAYAALPDPTAPLTDGPASPPSSGSDGVISEEEPPLPTPGSGYAIYDIKAKVVYMPSGERLEAHSGYGDTMDDISAIPKRMVGPTPPNAYSMVMREALFHGSEAVRLNPVGTGRMYGRTGFLVHPYLMGPRGDSNGCISVKDYDKFLTAFKQGEVKKMYVVVELKNGPKKDENFLLSWLKPR